MSGLFLVLILTVVKLQSAMASYHVIVDPGHGGHDKGAISKSVSTSEANIALQVAHYLKEEIDSESGYRATLTRERDEFISLEDRSARADKWAGDLFISIHINASRDPRAHGKEIYFQNQLPPDEESLFLANLENNGQVAKERKVASSDVATILEDLERNHRIFLSAKLSEFLHSSWISEGPKRRRPIRQAPFHVISNVNMPSALVEIGYISNQKEANRLINTDYQKEIALSIFRGIKQFKEFMDKTTRTKLD